MDTNIKLIGFTGKAGSGKTTAAKFLVEGRNFRVIKFAEPIKAMLRAIGLEWRELEGDLKEAPCPILGGKTPRFAMQTLGTEWGRQTIYQDIWVEAWAALVKKALDSGESIVCDDVRFPNEVATIKSLGGKIIDIVNPRAQDNVYAHVSETEILDYDVRILNNGWTIELNEKIMEHL